MDRRSFLLVASTAAHVPGQAFSQAGSRVVELGSRRELFVDRFLIDSMRGVDLRLQTPEYRGQVLAFDRPWEGSFCGYATVIRAAGRFQLYYRGVPNAGKDGREQEVSCYAESPDGIRWTRPELGIFEVAGTRANNVILAGQPPFSHNFCPMLDRRPGVPEGERYKALGGTSASGLAAFISADGIHWKKLRAEPVLPPAKETRYDSQNLAFWSETEGRYVCYFRTFKRIPDAGGVVRGVRWVSRTTSPDFLHWEPPQEMTFGDAPPEHLYTNQTSPYPRAPHIYISIAARFEPGRQVLAEDEARAIRVDPGYFKDCSDAVLFSTRGGYRYDRTFLEAFLRPGLGVENWVSRTNYPALNVVETAGPELSFYVNRNYGQPTAHLARYALRLDGFAALHAPYAGGEMTTRPFRFAGGALELNYATSAAGGIRIEIQDESGRPVPGYALEDSMEIIGDRLARDARWRGVTDVRLLTGKPVRLRFAMKDADLYSLCFH